MQFIKANWQHFAQVFVSSFLTTLGTLVLALPQESIRNPEFWKYSTIAGIVLTAATAAVKVAWEQVAVPVGQAIGRSFASKQ